MDFEKEALHYHEASPKGKIAIRCTKALDTQEDLSLAYSPGVAGPCRKIAENIDESFRYTARGNLVAVITNGTAVLGLGDIGPYAAKPVMEGKAMLFKKFADIDVFDLELDAKDPDDFIKAVKALEPSFGGVNLEDIKAPECFYIEETLRKEMSIPVFHDDQHGTAIIAGAALINALELTKQDITKTRLVISGAGAAAVSCATLFMTLGIKAENLVMCDSKGVIHSQRSDLNEYKKRFVVEHKHDTMQQALVDANVFVGVSKPGVFTPEMLKSMAPNPIVFALANPDPEIDPNLAIKTREDVIIATGRSDFPNQVNNVLGFPYIFRGALDARATCINEEMKLAAVKAIAALAKEDVPEEVISIYKKAISCSFGREYLIPKPVDHRVLLRVAPAVARAAIESGVARRKLNIADYEKQIERILGPTRQMIRSLRTDLAAECAKQGRTPKIVLTAGSDLRVLKAAKQCADSGELRVCLLGKVEKIKEVAEANGIRDLSQIELIDPSLSNRAEDYAKELYLLRNRRGVSRTLAQQIAREEGYFAAMMLHQGDADAMLSGIKSSYRLSVKPILEVIRLRENASLAGVYILADEKRLTFFADCTVHVDPTSEDLANIAISAAETARIYTTDPIRVALLSFASFGASQHPQTRKVARAVELIKQRAPELEVDGEMQVDVALDPELRKKEFPFSSLTDRANVLIFPDLSSANISYKLLANLGEASPTGPILTGVKKPAHALQRTANTQEIVNMIYLSAHQAMCLDEKKI